jgi:hypothetical protein
MKSYPLNGHSDAVQFEIGDLASAVRLTRRLSPYWLVTFEEGFHACLVTVQLRHRPDDVAVLLRAVERFVAEESLRAVRYSLDGRGYVLEAGDADWANVPAGRCA